MNPNDIDTFQKRKEAEEQLMVVCPKAIHKSGIYFYLREDLNGKHGYIGKATDLCDRNVTHILGYAQHIDLSIKSRGFYSEDNPSGWKLNVLYYPKHELDMWERHWIDQYLKAGYKLYNIESGGTNGKTMIGERKSPRGYRDGIKQGEKNVRKEVAKLFEKHLTFEIKGNPNAHSRKAYEKFKQFITIESEGDDNVEKDI